MESWPSFKSRNASLPAYSSAVEEKLHLTARPSRFFTTFYIPLPNRNRLQIPLPIPPAVWMFFVTRFGQRKASWLVWGVIFLLGMLCTRILKATLSDHGPTILGQPPTLVYGREDLRRIWSWEIASGHYPSTRKIPSQIKLTTTPLNPGIPPQKDFLKSKSSISPAVPRVGSTIGIGSRRNYIDIQAQPPNVAYPPRVPSGSIADLDVIMDNCDFSQNKYVRDCLEVMRLGAGLDVGKHFRRGKTDMWKYIYQEESITTRDQHIPEVPALSIKQQKLLRDNGDPNAGLWCHEKLEPPLSDLPKPVPPTPFVDLPKENMCDSDYPRIFHMFWAGEFNEKPYVALLSYLFTQNLGLHLDTPDPAVCRPQFWLWINPGPAAAVPNPNALKDMYDKLAQSPYAAPFLHPRFKDVIKFKMWNTTEMLDSVPELADDWRQYEDHLFNSGGVKYAAKKQMEKQKAEKEKIAAQALLDDDPAVNGTDPDGHPMSSAVPQDSDSGDLLNRAGSNSVDEYDRLSVILSDMARFLLTHRFGGIYLDADTILLRDWEELFGYKGAFAYRWSRLETYNTAVLKLNRRSALGTWLIRTAFRNNMDFHPMSVGKYSKHAFLETLLLRLPDALFDPAWLAQENYQRERQPFPMFLDFEHFFKPPATDMGAPQQLGFDGFFKGSYSYHFHNFWWVPFDHSRNFPDLGPRFKEGERKARAKLREAKAAATAGPNGERPLRSAPTVMTEEELLRIEAEEDDVLNDSRDLSWSAVMKRTFEAYIRGERPNMYGEWIKW